MAATQLGTATLCGVGTTLTTYIVTRYEINNKEVSFSDVKDEDGVLKTRIIKQTMPTVNMDLIALTNAAYTTDWPVGAKSAATGFTTYYVQSCTVTRTEDAAQVSVQLINLGI